MSSAPRLVAIEACQVWVAVNEVARPRRLRIVCVYPFDEGLDLRGDRLYVIEHLDNFRRIERMTERTIRHSYALETT